VGRTPRHSGWSRPRAASERLRDQELWVVWAGGGWMDTGAERFRLRPGFCAWMRPGGIYDAEQDEAAPLGINFIHFDLLDMETGRVLGPEDLRAVPEFYRHDDVAALDAMTRRVIRWYGQRARPGAQEVGERLLHALLQELLQVHRLGGFAREGDRWADALERLAAELRDRPDRSYDWAERASAWGVTRAHLSRRFRGRFGVAPQGYLRRCRIDAGRALLLETDWAVSRVARHCGFGDVYDFSRRFKQATGLAPTAFRRQGDG
jgi:AraC-like DNA-binding protein